MKNKVISLLLAVVLAVTAVGLAAVSTFAAGTSLTVSKVSEDASTVTVAVGISGNSGVAALGVNLNYDSSYLQYKGVSSAGVAADAGMAVFGSSSGDNVRIIIDESNTGNGTKKDGTVCTVTFSKLSSVKEGTSASFGASAISSATYDLDGESVEISDGSAEVSLKKVESTTKKPAPTQKPTTTKKPVVTQKPSTTKTPVTQKPNVVSPTLAGVTVPTTVAEETTTEETTTEEMTTEEWTTEYESYSYTAPANDEAEEDDEDKSGNTKRIIAIVVVVVCIAAAAALYFTKRK